MNNTNPLTQLFHAVTTKKGLVEKTALLLIVLLMNLNAFSYDLVEDGIYYNISNKSRHELTVTYGDKSYSGVITIPSTVSYNNDEYHVVSVGQNAFKNIS